MTVDRNNPNPSDRLPPIESPLNDAQFDVQAIESLSSAFDAEEIEIDRLLAHAARADARHVPAGLSQRVFAMSASMLPDAAAGQPTLKLVGADADREALVAHRPVRFAAWARLALAASVLLVAGVTMWTTWPTNVPQQPVAINRGGGGSVNGGGEGGEVGPSVSTVALNFDDLNALNASNPSAFDSYDGEFSYLLDASELRSFDDLNDDLVLLVQQLEM